MKKTLLLIVFATLTAMFATATTYPINIQSMDNGSVVSDKASAAIGETVTLTVTPDNGYELETLTVAAGYEVQGGSGGARAPHLKTWMGQGTISTTKVDDTHYTFVLPDELPSVLTPNYTDNTEFKVSATFKAVEPVKYTITVNSATNGTVESDKAEAAEGETVTLTVTPDNGYELDNLKVDDGTTGGIVINWAPANSKLKKEVSYTDNGDGTYSFTMPAKNVTVTATFKEVQQAVSHAIHVVTPTNGNVESDKSEALEGETVTLTITPDTGYELDNLSVYAIADNGTIDDPGEVWAPRRPKGAGDLDGTTLPVGWAKVADITFTKESDTQYTFTMPTLAEHSEYDVRVEATFMVEGTVKYPINIQSMDNGSVVSDKATAAIGETVTLTVTPDNGYELETLTVAAGYEVQGGSGGARAPHLKTWMGQGTISTTKVDDTHYTFVLPEELPSVLTPNYTDNTEFKVSATFKAVEPVKYTITVNSATNGTVESDKAEAAEGETVTLTVTPDNGYELDNLKVDDGTTGGIVINWAPANGKLKKEVSYTDNGDGTYSFTMPAKNVTVTATFKEVQQTGYQIIVEKAENCTVAPDKDNYEGGETVTINITPEDGTTFKSFSAYYYAPAFDDDEPDLAPRLKDNTTTKIAINETFNDLTVVEEGKTYTFTMVGANVYVEVIYEKAAVALAELLEDGVAVEDVTLGDNLAIVDVVASQGIAFATDGNGNWVELKLADGNIDDLNAITTAEAGTITGSFGYDGLNPALTLSALPSKADNDIAFELRTIPVSQDFAPQLCEVFNVVGYYHAAGGTNDGPNLRQWSGKNGGEQGVLLDLDLSWAAGGTMTEGEHYKIRAIAQLKEAWDPANAGRRPMASADDDMALRNYTIQAISVPDAPTAIQSLNGNSVAVKSVRYYNMQGIEMQSLTDGINIVVIEHADGTRTTTKVLR